MPLRDLRNEERMGQGDATKQTAEAPASGT
jgi:hypothetical protein